MLTCPTTVSHDIFDALNRRDPAAIEQAIEQYSQDELSALADENISLTWDHFTSNRDSNNEQNKKLLYKKYVPKDKTGKRTIPGWPGGYIYLPTFLNDTEKSISCCPDSCPRVLLGFTRSTLSINCI